MCFSEIPLDQLGRLVQRRSLYGIGFSKSYILSRGGGPVWYVQYASPAHLALKHQVQQAPERVAGLAGLPRQLVVRRRLQRERTVDVSELQAFLGRQDELVGNGSA